MNETLTMPLSPTLTNAVARILALAAQAAMQGKSDLDLLRALEAVQGEVFAAQMEYEATGSPVAAGGEDAHDDQDIPF